MNSSGPRQLLHYRLLRKIDSGGMGEVYKAEDTRLGRTVAIKLLLAGVNQEPTARRRFLQEAQSASALNHPNIVTIYAIEEVDGLDFIVMEFVEGQTLKRLIEDHGALGIPQLLDIGIQTAEALQAAHDINLIHRDIKAANILVTPRGHAKVLDFGLAKTVRTIADGNVDYEAQTLTSLTDEGTVLGTAAYMSPEQTRAQPLDARSDIFSLGSALYEAATRSLPFPGPSMLAIMHAIATAEPLAPSRVRPELPHEFDVIIERALAKDKERRYSSAAEMAQALKSLRATFTGEWLGGPIVYDKDLIEAPGAPFVGRGPELARLEGILQQAIDGSGGVVFITGEPGIGKTSLSDEFLRRARARFPGLSVSRGRCVEQYGTGEAYLPFLDAIGGLLGGPARERLASIMRTSAPTWCSQLPAAFASTAAMETMQQETIGATKDRMMREFGDALGIFAAASPVVLLLEDLHWADPSSVDLLRHVCQRIGNQRLLIAGTFRPEDVERTNHPLKSCKAEMQAHKLCEEIALDSLSPGHIQDYLNATFAPNSFPAEFATHIHEKTEGHPLFATNLMQYLHERGDIAKTNEHWSLSRPLAQMELELPESVRSMISKKVDALEAEARRTLQYASVEGQEFHSTVVAALLGVDEVDLEELLARLEKTERLVLTLGEEELPDGSLATRYRFAHALYQNFLYGGLVNKRKIMLHSQAGEQLARHYGKRAPQIATQLALHFERGRNFPRAVEYLIHAGDNATTLYGNAEAAEHYTRALSLAEKLADENQAQMLVVLFGKRGAANLELSRFSQSVDDYRSMLKHQEAFDSPEKKAAGLNALAKTLFFSHRLEEMEACVDEALAASGRAGSETLRLETMCLMALKHLCYGELEVGRPILDDVIESARAIDHKPALLAGLTWRGCLYFFQTDYERAIEIENEAKQLASRLRDGFHLLTSMFFLGLSKGNLGRMSEAIATLEEAIKMAGRNGDRFWFPRMPNCIGWLHRELQDFEGAQKHNREGLEIARQYHVLEAEANSLINLGIDHTFEGKPQETIAAFRETREIFERDAWFRWRYNIRLEAATAWHWLRQGDLEQAREFAQRLLAAASGYEVHKYIAEAHRLKAHIAIAANDPDGAEVEFAAALDELQRHPAPLIAWRTYADLGRLQSERGRLPDAQAAFTKAAEIVSACAANVTDENLRATFLNSSAVRRLMAGATETARNVGGRSI
jgi:tetratricopeptide (TPR) repeat protein/tRNA A-37 threonylcarbamoyl transferase component Bud32